MKTKIVLFLLLVSTSVFAQDTISVNHSEEIEGEYMYEVKWTQTKTTIDSIKFDPYFLSDLNQLYDNQTKLFNKDTLKYSELPIFIIFGDTTFYRLQSFQIFPPKFHFEIWGYQSVYNEKEKAYSEKELVRLQDEEYHFIFIWIVLVIFVLLLVFDFRKKGSKKLLWFKGWIFKDLSSILTFFVLSVSSIWFLTLLVDYRLENICLTLFSSMILSGFFVIFFTVIFFLLWLSYKIIQLIIWIIYVCLKRPLKLAFLSKRFSGIIFKYRVDKMTDVIYSCKKIDELKKAMKYIHNDVLLESIRERIRQLKNKESEEN